MSLADSVVVNVILGRPGVTAPGFGVPLIASQNAADVFGGDITRTYAKLSDVLEDFAATTPEYNAARAIFSQDLSVSRIRIGKLPTNPVTQRWSISVASAGVNRTYTAKVWLADGTVLTADYDTTAASNAGTVISSTNPINILPNPAGAGTWEISIDQGAAQTWTFAATRGFVLSGAGAFSGTNGTFVVRANEDPNTDQTITVTTASTTRALNIAQINSQALYFTVVDSAPDIRLESNRYGSSTNIRIVSGDAGTLTDLGLAVGLGTAGTAHCQKTAGTGNKLVTIGLCDAATPAEVALAIVTADDVTGGSLVVNDGGFLQLTTDTAGASPDGVHVLTAGSLTLGFDTAEHNGTATGGATNDDIITGLEAAINALPDLPAITLSQTGSVGSKSLQLIANATTVWFGVEIANPGLLHCVQNQSAPTSSGLATDLTSIANSTTDWYGLITLYNSALYVEAAAAWVFGDNTKFYDPAVSDTICSTISYGSGTDVLHALKASGYKRTAGFFHQRAAQFPDAAQDGYFLPIPPGSDNWRMKTLQGVTSGWADGEQYSSTQTTNLEDRNANYYADIGGVSVIGGNGVTASGEYIDVLRGLDWFVANLSTNLINLLIQNNKVPFTNAGIAQIVGVCRSMVQTGIDAGVIDPGDPPGIPVPTVTALKKSQVGQANRDSRTLASPSGGPGVSITFVLAGAINKILVTVNVSQ